MRPIKVDADKYARLTQKYLAEDLSDLLGVDMTDAPYSHAADDMMADATDAALADDILDGAARWYAYKQTVKIAKALKSGGAR